jgi:hypothetical protein
MSACTDPIAALRRAQEQSCMCGCLDSGPSDESMGGAAALAEFERRARIEARLHDWLESSSDHDVRVRRYKGQFEVYLYRYSSDERLSAGRSQDYWTAAEAALDAAGAP